MLQNTGHCKWRFIKKRHNQTSMIKNNNNNIRSNLIT